MADRHQKYHLNVPGRYYVDNTCIDCDLCRNIAPGIFLRDETGGHSYVAKQPETELELALAEEARVSCPTETIGNDGDS